MSNVKISALFYQKILIQASLDSINGFNILKAKDYEDLSPPVRWREHYFVADFIFRNMQAELIERVECDNLFDGGECDLSIAESFLVTPFDNNSETSLVLWNAVNFQGTNKLMEMLKKYGLLEWSVININVDEKFINELSGIYHDCGLGDFEFCV